MTELMYFYFIATESCDKQKYTNLKMNGQEIYNQARIPGKKANGND